MDLRATLVGIVVASLLVWLAGVLWVLIALVRGAQRAPSGAIVAIGLGFGISAITGALFFASYAMESTGPLILVVVAPSVLLGLAVLKTVARNPRRPSE